VSGNFIHYVRQRHPERVEGLCWSLFEVCEKTTRAEPPGMPGNWHKPKLPIEKDACRELERLGKLEKHPERDWWRRRKEET